MSVSLNRILSFWRRANGTSAFRCRDRGINGKSDRPSINRFSHDKTYIIVYTARIISLVHVLQRARVITRRRSRTREINPRYSISLTINQNGNYCYAFTVKRRSASSTAFTSRIPRYSRRFPVYRSDKNDRSITAAI